MMRTENLHELDIIAGLRFLEESSLVACDNKKLFLGIGTAQAAS